MLHVLDVVLRRFDDPLDFVASEHRLINRVRETWAGRVVQAETDMAAGIIQFAFDRRPLAQELQRWLQRQGDILIAELRGPEVLFHWERGEEG